MSEHNQPAPGESLPTSGSPDGQSPEALRRDFLKRFGVYAATAPLVTYALMSPRTAKAVGSFSDGGPT